jgi:uncharacterized UPF0160 family protein
LFICEVLEVKKNCSKGAELLNYWLVKIREYDKQQKFLNSLQWTVEIFGNFMKNLLQFNPIYRGQMRRIHQQESIIVALMERKSEKTTETVLCHLLMIFVF